MQIYTRFSILKISHFGLYTYQISSHLFCANISVSRYFLALLLLLTLFFFLLSTHWNLFPYGSIFCSSDFIHCLIVISSVYTVLFCIPYILMTSKFISSTQISTKLHSHISRYLIGKHHLNVLKNPQAQNVQQEHYFIRPHWDTSSTDTILVGI